MEELAEMKDNIKIFRYFSFYLNQISFHKIFSGAFFLKNSRFKPVSEFIGKSNAA